MPESETPRTRRYDLQKANAWSLVFFAVLIPLYLLPYYAIWVGAWEWEQILQVLRNSADNNSLLSSLVFFLLIVGGIVVHELIHGLTWAYHASSGWRSIRFGVFWKALAPYCHCVEPMLRNHHLKAVLMPGVVLGLLPALVGLALGLPNWVLFGWFFTGVAAGDVIMAGMMLKEPASVKLRDMDDALGFYIYEVNDASSA